MSSKQPTFEEQLSTLETIVAELEKGDLTLEDSLAQFENGVKLTRQCQKLLDQAQQKVAILTQDEQQLEPFSKD